MKIRSAVNLKVGRLQQSEVFQSVCFLYVCACLSMCLRVCTPVYACICRCECPVCAGGRQGGVRVMSCTFIILPSPLSPMVSY